MIEDPSKTITLNPDELEQQTESIRHEANLRVLRKADPNILNVVKRATFVSAYVLNELEQLWSRADIEGALYVVIRDQQPKYRLIILNQRNPQNLVEAITAAWEISAEDNYIFFRVPVDPTATVSSADPTARRVAGLWFSDDNERREVQNAIEIILDELYPDGKTDKVKDDIEVSRTDISGELEIHPPARKTEQKARQQRSIFQNREEPKFEDIKTGHTQNASYGATLDMKVPLTSCNEEEKTNGCETSSSTTQSSTRQDGNSAGTSILNIAASASFSANTKPFNSKASTSNTALSPGATILSLLGVVRRGSISSDQSGKLVASSVSPSLAPVIDVPISIIAPTLPESLDPVIEKSKRLRIADCTAVATTVSIKGGVKSHQHQVQDQFQSSSNTEVPLGDGLVSESPKSSYSGSDKDKHNSLMNQKHIDSRAEETCIKQYRLGSNKMEKVSVNRNQGVLIPNVTPGVLFKKPTQRFPAASAPTTAPTVNIGSISMTRTSGTTVAQVPADGKITDRRTKKQKSRGSALKGFSEDEVPRKSDEKNRVGAFAEHSARPKKEVENPKLSKQGRDKTAVEITDFKIPGLANESSKQADVLSLDSSANAEEVVETSKQVVENSQQKLERLLDSNLRTTFEKRNQLLRNEPRLKDTGLDGEEDRLDRTGEINRRITTPLKQERQQYVPNIVERSFLDRENPIVAAPLNSKRPTVSSKGKTSGTRKSIVRDQPCQQQQDAYIAEPPGSYISPRSHWEQYSSTHVGHHEFEPLLGSRDSYRNDQKSIQGTDLIPEDQIPLSQPQNDFFSATVSELPSGVVTQPPRFLPLRRKSRTTRDPESLMARYRQRLARNGPTDLDIIDKAVDARIDFRRREVKEKRSVVPFDASSSTSDYADYLIENHKILQQLRRARREVDMPICTRQYGSIRDQPPTPELFESVHQEYSYPSSTNGRRSDRHSASERMRNEQLSLYLSGQDVAQRLSRQEYLHSNRKDVPYSRDRLELYKPTAGRYQPSPEKSERLYQLDDLGTYYDEKPSGGGYPIRYYIPSQGRISSDIPLRVAREQIQRGSSIQQQSRHSINMSSIPRSQIDGALHKYWRPPQSQAGSYSRLDSFNDETETRVLFPDARGGGYSESRGVSSKDNQKCLSNRRRSEAPVVFENLKGTVHRHCEQEYSNESMYPSVEQERFNESMLKKCDSLPFSQYNSYRQSEHASGTSTAMMYKPENYHSSSQPRHINDEYLHQQLDVEHSAGSRYPTHLAHYSYRGR